MAIQPNDEFNIARGKVRYYLELPAADDALVIVLLKAAGLVTDTALADYADLATLLAGSCDECDFTAYGRKVATSAATISTNTATDRVTGSTAGFAWDPAGGATNNSIGKLLVCYRPTSGSADSAVIPLLFFACATTTDGTRRQVDVNAAGLWYNEPAA